MATQSPSRAELEKALRGMTRLELLEMARASEAAVKKKGRDGPTTDDELHDWVKTNLGIVVPRKAVCEGHNAPFEFLSDLYFERTSSALLMANRGGSKTFLVAVLHLLNSVFKPGVESATVGAIEMQARRAYMHLQKMLERYGQDVVAAAIMSETRFKNGSRVEVLPGTLAAVNGPHPSKVHFDEVELADPEVFQESRNMSQSQYLSNGMLTASQDIITSTRKRGHGMMQQLLDQIQDAKLNNATPPYELYVWCAYESAVNVPNCVMANPDVENPCPCKDVYGGKWEDGTPRTLADCCKGRLARSDGFVPLGDIINTFTKTSRGIWEAQQECIKPSTEGLILPDFKRETHCVVNWQADPDDGPIFQAVDWGGTNPHGVEWCQLTRREVTAKNIAGEEIRVPEGSIVFFDEIYEAGIGNNALADKVVKRERMWRGKWPRFRISVRFPDPQGKAARLDWAAHDPPLPTKFMATREVEEHIKLAVERVEQGTVFLDAKRTPMLIDEIEAWHYQKPKAGMVDQPIKPVDDFNHAVSAFRYALANIHVMIKNGSIGTGALPKAGEVRSAAASGNETAAGIPTTTGGRLQQGGLGLPDSERWRGAYGPATAWRP